MLTAITILARSLSDGRRTVRAAFLLAGAKKSSGAAETTTWGRESSKYDKSTPCGCQPQIDLFASQWAGCTRKTAVQRASSSLRSRIGRDRAACSLYGNARVRQDH